MARNDATVLTEHAARELIRAYREQRRELANLKMRLASFGTRRHQGRFIPPPKIKFKNDSSETAPAWGVLRITGANANDYLTIDKPDTSFQRLYLVNGPKDVASGAYGFGHYLTSEAFSFKHSRVLYDTGATPAYGESWGPKSDQWTIAKWRYGFTIMGGNSGSGSTSRTVAVQAPVNVIYGQTQGTVADGATGTIEVYDGNNTILNASTTISAVHRFSATTIADNAKVACAWHGGTWNIIAARCS